VCVCKVVLKELFLMRRKLNFIYWVNNTFISQVDGKVRTDLTFPAGLMDVITIEKTNEKFRLVFDSKGRYAVHRISDVVCFLLFILSFLYGTISLLQ
jgi:hypothetical protein